MTDNSMVDTIVATIANINSLFDLNGVYRVWEQRMKEIAATILKPGSSDPIDEFSGGLAALDYIWDLHGDYVFGSGLPNHFMALDYYVGRKVQHVWGTGVLVKMTTGYGIRVRLRCGTEGCRGTTTVYARPGCHNGAFCYVHDRTGKYLADLRNQWFKCRRCHRGA